MRSPGRAVALLAARIVPVTFAAIVIAPIVWAAIGAFKTPLQLWKEPLALPRPATLDSFRAAVESGVLGYWSNSLLLSIVCVAAMLLLASLAAYAFSRLRFAGRGWLRTLIVSGMMVPAHAVLIPLYILSARVGIHGTALALIGPYIAFGMPLSVLLLTAYFSSVPREVEDAARIDGCSEGSIWWHVVMPMSRPGLAAVAIVQGVWVWNEFPMALVLVTEQRWKTLPVGLAEFQGQYSGNLGAILAGAVIASVPLLILFFAFQRVIIQGMTAGALKD